MNLYRILFGQYFSANADESEDNNLNQYGSVDLDGNGTAVDFGYDANGNLTDDSVYTYTYDYANMLVEVSDGSTVAAYTYDHSGRRITKTVGDVTTLHLQRRSRHSRV